MSRSVAAVAVSALVLLAAWLVFSDQEGGEVGLEPGAGVGAEAPRDPEAPAPAGPPPAPGDAPGEPVVVVSGEREPAPVADDAAGVERPADLSWGRVVDPWGAPVAGVMVHASVPGFRGVGGKVVAAADTDRDGRFSFGVTKQLDAVRIDFVKEGYARERRSGSFRDMHVVLEPLRAARIEGRLIGPTGAPLSPDDLLFLFGAGDPDVAPPPFFSPSAVVAAPDRSLGQPEVEREATVATDASFVVEEPRFFFGEVVLLFRGRVLARVPWQDGDAPVLFEVDVGALRRAIGRLEVSVTGLGADDEPVDVDLLRRAPLTNREESESFELVPPGPCVVDGLTAGRYRVVARRGDAVALGEAVVKAGGTARVAIGLVGPARVRVALRWLDGDPLQPSQVHVTYRDAAGTAHDVDQHPSSVGGRTVVALEAPAGSGVFTLDGNVLPIDLTPGENVDVDWELRRSRLVRLRVQVTAPSRADRPRSAECHVELRTADGAIALRAAESVPIAPDGFADVPATVPPGRYRLAVEFGELRRLEASIAVTADDEQELVFPFE